MKKLLLAIIFTNSLMSELVIEITQGTEDPFKVALVQFGGNVEISEELSQIIKGDLKRSGEFNVFDENNLLSVCLLYTSPSPRDATLSRMPSSA